MSGEAGEMRGATGDFADAGVRHDGGGLGLVVLAVLAYSAIHVGFRVWASSALGEDDVYDNILVQELRLAWEARQPPLYDWVLYGVQRLTGPSLASFLLIKYIALTATAAFLYLAALRVLGSRVWAFLTVESLALIYQIAWRYHEGFTHEVLAMVAVAATLWAYLRVVDNGRLGDFVLLGVIGGLGALTEPSYSVYLLCLFLAGLLQPAIRARVLRPGFLATLAVGFAIASPFLYWLISDPIQLKQLLRPPRDPWHEVVRGLFDGLRGPILYLSPLIVFMPFVFPGFLRVALADLRRAPNRTAEPDLAQLVLHGAYLAILMSLLGAIAFGIGGYPVHALMPLYVSTVAWLFSAAKRGGGGELGISRFARLAGAIALLALVVRLANMFVLDPVCNTCRWGVPWPALADDLRRHGLSRGTIVTFEHPIGGNLRQLLPEATFISRRYPVLTPAGADKADRPMALVWSSEWPESYAYRFFAEFIPPDRRLDEARQVVIPWKHLWKPEGYRVSDWRVLILE
ncbi:MAG: glycosyltransferase family 39 protein [Pseudomonadota bacterium]